MYTHMDNDRSFSSIKTYAIKRLVRIFPAYLPISFGVIALYYMMPGLSESGGREFSLLSSLFLLPADNPPALNVAWTLVHELLFYFVFLTFFLSGKLFAITLLLWGGGILFANIFESSTGWLRYPLSSLNVDFMMGVLSAWYVRSCDPKLNPRVFIIAGLVLSSGILMMIADSQVFQLVFAFGLALIIVGYALIERSASLVWPSMLLLIGNDSYSIYLIHAPLLSVTQRWVGKFDINSAVGMFFGVAVSLLIGITYFSLVERPALNYFRKKIRTK